MMKTEYRHQPVLLNEVIENLAINPKGIYIDATFGRGGHASEIMKYLGPEGRLLAFDKDPEALQAVPEYLQKDARFKIVHGSFANLVDVVSNESWLNKVDGILMDLGVSSPQLDDPKRGFSFLQPGPLDMRMNPEHGISAADWINQAEEEEIASVLKEYGEERFAKRIAGFIVAERETNPFRTTEHLAAVVSKANPAWEQHKHPATRSFQAIRIFINNELEDLEIALNQSLEILKPGGRLLVISFHSLEDRIVKQFIRYQQQGPSLPKGIPVTKDAFKARLKAVGKVVVAKDEEVKMNPRSRSAKLRIAEKIA